MQLPNEWLWEMLDEFIYQFQSFCQYRGKLTMRTAEEIALLKKHVGVWDVKEVLNVLKALVDQSGIVGLLTAEGGVMRLYEADGIIDKVRFIFSPFKVCFSLEVFFSRRVVPQGVLSSRFFFPFSFFSL